MASCESLSVFVLVEMDWGEPFSVCRDNPLLSANVCLGVAAAIMAIEKLHIHVKDNFQIQWKSILKSRVRIKYI